MNIGYARVSTDDQNLSLQTDALTLAGCEKIYKEKLSGAKADRPELLKLIEQLREGDTLTVWKLDRLGRSLTQLIETVNKLAELKVGFRSLKESIDTTTATGKLTFHIFASFAEFERDMIRERTNAGLNAARERGRVGGRKKGLSPDAERKATAVKALYLAENTVDNICKMLNIGSKRTVYKYLRLKGVKIGAETKSESINLVDQNIIQ